MKARISALVGLGPPVSTEATRPLSCAARNVSCSWTLQGCPNTGESLCGAGKRRTSRKLAAKNKLFRVYIDCNNPTLALRSENNLFVISDLKHGEYQYILFNIFKVKLMYTGANTRKYLVKYIGTKI